MRKNAKRPDLLFRKSGRKTRPLSNLFRDEDPQKVSPIFAETERSL